MVPVLQAASGMIIDISLEGLILGPGLVLILVAVSLALSPAPRSFEMQVEYLRLSPQAAA